MFWKTAWTTFTLVFLAELGDKTQLATMLLAAESRALGAVFAGSAAALVLSSFIGVLAGEALTRLVSPQFLKTAAGFAFILLGLVMLVKRG
ncbi:MAG: TMEM165/GDT1 family protein [bacterium]|nr:TMEM165/GDT1 family protein [Bacillota bacterium]